jgi:hypothetical protein
MTCRRCGGTSPPAGVLRQGSIAAERKHDEAIRDLLMVPVREVEEPP